MTYAEYKQYILRTLRREGDTDLLADLDEIIKYGEDKMTRDLRTILSVVTGYPIIMTTLTSPLPADFRSVKHLVGGPDGLPLLVTSADNLTRLAKLAADIGEWLGYYTVAGQSLIVAGPVAPTGDTPTLTYNRRVPSYKTLDSQPFRDTLGFSDLYDYAVLSGTPMYLREDARLPNFAGLYREALESANNETAQLEWGSAPLGSMLPEGIA